MSHPTTFSTILARCLGESSKAELARRLGVSRSTLNYWLAGQYRPSRASYLRLLDAFPQHAADLQTALVA